MTTGKRIYGFLLLHNSAYCPITEILINTNAILSVRPIINEDIHGNAEIQTTCETIYVKETMEEIIRIIETPTKRNPFQKEKEHPE